MDCTALLLALLELTIPYRQFEAQFASKIILTPPAELCRAAHRALCQIAKSRASTFITTVAREVARHTTAVVNPGTVQKLHSSTLVRAKDEVLRIIEMLTEKIPNAVSDLLGEVNSRVKVKFNFCWIILKSKFLQSKTNTKMILNTNSN